MLAMLPAHILYAAFRLLPVHDKVLFISRQADRPSYDFIRLADEIARRSPQTRQAMLCRCMGETPLGRIAYVPEIVRQMYHLATARVCILDGYAVPVCMMRPRKGLLVIQAWHALGAIKRFGYQSVGMPAGRSEALARAMRMHANYDLALCGCESMVPVFAEAFRMDSARVLPIGLPRVDYLLECVSDQPPQRHVVTVEKLTARYPVLAESGRRILYAPTYRRTRSSILPEMLGALSAEKCTLIVKLHDLEHRPLGEADVVDATGINILDLLPLVDVVVTDYSAVAYEAGVLGKPVYFYVPDIEEYRQENGLNVDVIEVLPRAASKDAGQIAAWAMDSARDEDVRSAFEPLCAPIPAHGCTAAIADRAMDHLKGNARG